MAMQRNGKCRLGRACKYAHTESDLRSSAASQLIRRQPKPCGNECAAPKLFSPMQPDPLERRKVDPSPALPMTTCPQVGLLQPGKRFLRAGPFKPDPDPAQIRKSFTKVTTSGQSMGQRSLATSPVLQEVTQSSPLHVDTIAKQENCDTCSHEGTAGSEEWAESEATCRGNCDDALAIRYTQNKVEIKPSGFETFSDAVIADQHDSEGASHLSIPICHPSPLRLGVSPIGVAWVCQEKDPIEAMPAADAAREVATMSGTIATQSHVMSRILDLPVKNTFVHFDRRELVPMARRSISAHARGQNAR